MAQDGEATNKFDTESLVLNHKYFNAQLIKQNLDSSITQWGHGQ
jgi:hypothetical protein